jgi:DNA polymerase epsilon subunit 4
VKTERKPRRNIQYRDVSSAIAKTDNLEFAVDVVPKTVLWKEARKKREEREEREKVVEEGKNGDGEVNGEEDAETNGGAEENEEEPKTNGNGASVSTYTTGKTRPHTRSYGSR